MSSGCDNYFTLLNLPPTAEIERDVLDAHYFSRQRQCHPDSFVGNTTERNLALNAAMQLNEAYATLKNPLKRAEYLLLLEGLKVNTETGGIKASPMVLMEAMEAREKLLEASTVSALKALEMEAAEDKKHLFQQFVLTYNNAQFEEAAQWVIRLKYTEKLSEEIKAKRRIHAA